MSAIHLTQTTLDTLYTSFRMQFRDGMQKATQLYKDLAMIIQSNSTIENYPIVEQFGKMREWIGPRKIEELNFQMLAVKNKDFENAVRVSRNAIADDQVGIYGVLVAGLGQSAENLWDDLIFDALCTPDNWVDNAAFFSTSRTYGDNSTICNKTTSHLSHANYVTARNTMMGYTGHAGAPLNVVPDTLVVGPSNETLARKIVDAKFMLEDGTLTDNLMYGTAKVIVSTRLTGTHANKWYLMSTQDVIKPIILQQREQPSLSRIDAPESEYVFRHNENLYGTFARGAAALAVPHLVYGGGQ